MTSNASTGEPQAGLSILVVEDEFLIAMDLEDILVRHGCRVLGPAPTVQAALELLERETPVVALLDVNLRGERVTPVAALLRARRIPFLIASAYDAREIDCSPVLREAHKISKPISERRLLKALDATLRAARGG